MSKRELRIEISIQYDTFSCKWNTAELAEIIRDIQNVAKQHLVDPDIQITDEVVDNTPCKMFCPHCDRLISGVIFKEGE